MSPSESSYVPAYDGLRFFLLLAVLEFHYLYFQTPMAQIWYLSYALSCFFVLSGYLITQLLLRPSPPQTQRSLWSILRTFYIRRGLRVFPAYFFVVTVAALTLGVPYLSWHLCYLFNVKFFLLSVGPDSREFLRYLESWDHNGAHLWSMGVEEQFYLLYPPLLLLTPKSWRTAGLGLGIAACIGCRLWLSQAYPESYYGLLLPVPGEYLLWGCLMAWLDHMGMAAWLSRRAVYLAAVAVLSVLFVMDTDVARYAHGQWQPPAHQTAYAVLLALFVLGLKHNPRSWLTQLLSWKPFVRLGKISYSAYLVHLFLNPLIDRVTLAFPGLTYGPLPPRALLGPLFSIGTAWLLWISFEQRANRAKDYWAPTLP